MENNYVANLILFTAPEKTEIQANSCERKIKLLKQDFSETHVETMKNRNLSLVVDSRHSSVQC
jgi:hypothetical protein